MSVDTRVHWVYELWADDHCLYVGMTVAPIKRLGDHRREQSWWPQVTRVKSIECNGWSTASLLERASIRELRPEFNVRDNPEPRGGVPPTVPAA